jgi:AcrR family transcriptional regulator
VFIKFESLINPNMGIAERKEREKQEMKDQILQAAMDLFIEEGYEKASIRKIADRIEYSPATIYLYFKDKDEIFHAVHEKGFEIFFERMEETAVIPDPFQRLKKLGEIYLNFAFENPQLYDLMFIMWGPMDAMKDGTHWHCGVKAHDGLKQMVRDCIETGKMKSTDVDITAMSIWSFVHGVASLRIRNRFRMCTPEELETMIPASLDMMLQLFRRE